MIELEEWQRVVKETVKKELDKLREAGFEVTEKEGMIWVKKGEKLYSIRLGKFMASICFYAKLWTSNEYFFIQEETVPFGRIAEEIIWSYKSSVKFDKRLKSLIFRAITRCRGLEEFL